MENPPFEKAVIPLGRDMPQGPIQPAIKKHANQIGEIAWAWNNMCTAMLTVFATLIDAKNLHPGVTIWHTLASDKTQREVLVALAKSRLEKNDINLDAITWVCSSATSLSGYRNAFVHAPVHFKENSDKEMQAFVPEVSAPEKYFNKLGGDDITSIYEKLLGDIISLAAYANAIFFVMNAPHVWTLPEKPSLLTLPK